MSASFSSVARCESMCSNRSVSNMKFNRTLLILLTITTCLHLARSHAGSYSRDTLRINEKEFNSVAQNFRDLYCPLAASNAAKLRLDSNWEDDSHEAHAGKNGRDWFVYIAGGIARDRDASLDSLTFTLCHEFGHEFAGYPFVNLPGNEWNTKEGETDYYAAFVCAKRIWKDDLEQNAKASFAVDSFAKSKCDLAWSSINERNLCYRIVSAGQRMINIEARNALLPAPKFSTPERKKEVTIQCRLDSVLQGATCTAPYIFSKIPGYLDPGGINSSGARSESVKTSCDRLNGFTIGLKPSCWWP